jgi:hypothetical protein
MIRFCLQCNRQASPEEVDAPVYDINYRPVYAPLPAETARFLKRVELNAFVNQVIEENRASPLV